MVRHELLQWLDKASSSTGEGPQAICKWTSFNDLTACILDIHNNVIQLPFWAQYDVIQLPFWAQYDVIQLPFWTQYDVIQLPFWAQYDVIQLPF